MQGVFCLAWSSEVIQGGRFALKWDTKKEKKMSKLATMQTSEMIRKEMKMYLR